MATQQYQQASEHFLAQARLELAGGDLAQASEKGWGAAAQMLKAIAERRGWEHNRHRHYHRRPAGCEPRPGTVTSAAYSPWLATSTKTFTRTTWKRPWCPKASTTWRPFWTSSARYWPERSLGRSASTSIEISSIIASLVPGLRRGNVRSRIFKI